MRSGWEWISRYRTCLLQWDQWKLPQCTEKKNLPCSCWCSATWVFQLDPIENILDFVFAFTDMFASCHQLQCWVPVTIAINNDKLGWLCDSAAQPLWSTLLHLSTRPFGCLIWPHVGWFHLLSLGFVYSISSEDLFSPSECD